MRRILIALMLFAFALVVAGCGNKGPLVRPPSAPDAAQPAPASSTAVPVPAPASSPASTAPAYLSPPMPASSTGSP